MRSDYPGIIGKTVRGKIDRPLGSRHPRHPEMVYPVNYGYVENVFAEHPVSRTVFSWRIAALNPVCGAARSLST